MADFQASSESSSRPFQVGKDTGGQEASHRTVNDPRKDLHPCFLCLAQWVLNKGDYMSYLGCKFANVNLLTGQEKGEAFQKVT